MDTLIRKFWRALTGPPSPAGPRVLPAYAVLARHRTGVADLEPRLLHLVSQLAAERSRCRWCIERGRHLWREAGLPLDTLQALLRYETSTLFSSRERAALRFADAVTRYSESHGGMPPKALTRARQQLTEAEIAAITATVAAQHFFNPITGALGADVAPWGAPIGSAVRSFWL
jgi:alkylhydroperoxidase family enzyme